MAYLLPRAVFVLIAWGMTCVLIRKFWQPADPTIFGVVGASLVAVVGGYFGYLNKLRRDIEALERARGRSINRATRA
jgi:hypothetical protein